MRSFKDVANWMRREPRCECELRGKVTAFDGMLPVPSQFNTTILRWVTGSLLAVDGLPLNEKREDEPDCLQTLRSNTCRSQYCVLHLKDSGIQRDDPLSDEEVAEI